MRNIKLHFLLVHNFAERNTEGRLSFSWVSLQVSLRCLWDLLVAWALLENLRWRERGQEVFPGLWPRTNLASTYVRGE